MNINKRILLVIIGVILCFYIGYSLLKESYSDIGNEIVFDYDVNVDKENKVIMYLQSGTTVGDLLKKMKSNIIDLKTQFIIYDLNNTLKNNYSMIATGDRLVLKYFPGNVIVEYTLSVLGDVNGDGNVNVTDVSKLFQYYRGQIDMEDYFVKAGDVLFNAGDVSLITNELDLYTGDSQELKYVVFPNKDFEISLVDVAKLYQYIREKKELDYYYTLNHDVIWSSSDVNVVTANNGLVNALKEGSSTITVETVNGFSDTCIVRVNPIIQYYAEFDGNGAEISSSLITCPNSDGCIIEVPTITRNGYEIIGFSTDQNSRTAEVESGMSIELTNNVKYYAITKKINTAFFESSMLDVPVESKSCYVYNKEVSCKILLPEFNKAGYFNEFWGLNSNASSNLKGNAWNKQNFNQVGHDFELTNNVILYPNFNHYYYHIDKNAYKYRSIDVYNMEIVGRTIFEFENGIPQSVIDTFISIMSDVYNIFPWLFSSGKVFVMTESTYDEHSSHYALTHNMYSAYGGDSHFTIDLKYDASGVVVKNAIDINAILHELAHAWDSRYNFQTGTGRISSNSDFDEFYNSITSKLYVDNSGQIISKIETFAAMFTNYYWHILGNDLSKSYYALKSNVTLNSLEKQNLKTLMEQYIEIAENGY